MNQATEVKMNKEQKLKLIKDSIRDIPDFPKPGIIFKDITTLLNNKDALVATTDLFAEKFANANIDFIVGLESRGFIFGAALADRLGIAFVPVRKPGKLPSKTIQETYELEYGSDTIEIHEDAFEKSERKNVLVVDDLLATGGTAAASINLIKKLGANPLALAVVIELDFLNGKDKLPSDTEVFSLINY